MNEVRCAVIGAGGFAEVCHVPGIQSHSQGQVVVLCGRNREHAQARADRLGVPEVMTDYRDVLARDDIDAVTIVTPNVWHREIALAAFQAGKHVLCEKPLAMDAQESAEMMSAAEQSSKVAMVAFTFRYLYSLGEMRRRVRAGDVGRPFAARIRFEGWRDLATETSVGWRHVKSLSGTGMLGDMGSHCCDTIAWVVGPIHAITGQMVTLPRERTLSSTGERVTVDVDDLAESQLVAGDGVRGSWIVSGITPSTGENGFVEVVGESGSLRAPLNRGERDELSLYRPRRDPELLPLTPDAADGKPHASLGMMRCFVDAVLRGAPDGDRDATFADGHRTQQCLDAVVKSDVERCWVTV